MVRLPKESEISAKKEIPIPLRQLSRAVPNLAETLQLMDPHYLTTLDDRALAIVDGANMERALERALIWKMRLLSKTERDSLFVGDNAPLQSLSAKIKIGYAFELFGKRTLTELDLIRVIRNQFAHSAKPITFKTPSIKTACASLRAPSRVSRVHPSFYPAEAVWPPIDARMLYHFSTEHLATAFILINEPPSHLRELNEMYLPLD